MLAKLGQSFAWTPPETPFSSFQFLLACVIGYPVSVFAGQWLLQRGPKTYKPSIDVFSCVMGSLRFQKIVPLCVYIYIYIYGLVSLE